MTDIQDLTGAMKVYVTQRGSEYRINLREPDYPYKEVHVPPNSAYLLLAAQATTDALQDALETIYHKTGDNVLSWREIHTDEDKNDNWQKNDPEKGDTNVW